MEIEQLQLWARWLELQRNRVMAVVQLEEEEVYLFIYLFKHI